MFDHHCHLYGSLTPAHALALGADHAVDWGWASRRWSGAGLAGDPRDPAAWSLDGPSGFTAFQAHYDVVAACSRWISGQHGQLDTAQAEELEQVVALVPHPAEFRLLLPISSSPRFAAASLACVLKALEGTAESTLAVGLPRRDPLRYWPIVAGIRHPRLTGIDFCGLEGEPDELAAIAPLVRARGLSLLIHVGEQLRQVQPLTAIRRVEAALRLGAHRLGHALAIRLDPASWPATPAWERVEERRRNRIWLGRSIADLAGLADDSQLPAEHISSESLRSAQDRVLRELAATGTVVEACPTSNRIISGAPVAAHGLGRLDAAGVAWLVASDDPGILGTDLAREHALAEAAVGHPISRPGCPPCPVPTLNASASVPRPPAGC